MVKQDNFGIDYSYFNIHFKDWERSIYRLWWFCRAVIEIVIPIRLSRGAKILSVGAGLGQLEHILSKVFGYDVYLVDISPYAKKLNKDLFKNSQYTTSSSDKLPFSDNFFDLVISYDLLEHLPDENSLISTFVEMKRVLKKEKGINMFHKITVLREEEIDKDKTHYLKWTADKWKEWFRNEKAYAVKKTYRFIPVWSNRRIKFVKVLGEFYLSLF